MRTQLKSLIADVQDVLEDAEPTFATQEDWDAWNKLKAKLHGRKPAAAKPKPAPTTMAKRSARVQYKPKSASWQHEAVLSEASEIEMNELPSKQLNFVTEFTKAAKLLPKTYWEGGNGYIVEFEANILGNRLSRKLLELLLANPVFRWVETSEKGDTLAIGM